MLVNRLKFGEITKKDLLCTKMHKNGSREFDHSETLTVLSVIIGFLFNCVV